MAATSAPPPPLHRPRPDEITAAVRVLRQAGAALLVDGVALHSDLGEVAARIAKATGARLMQPFFAARFRRGGGALRFERLAYRIEENLVMLAGITQLVLCGTTRPAGFFAYPGKPSLPENPDGRLIELCGPEMDIGWTLAELAREIGAESEVLGRQDRVLAELPALPGGAMGLEKVGQAIAGLMPEDAVLVDEGVSSSRFLTALAGARGHDVLTITGGSIGFGLPVAVGAAVACPERKVVVLEGDGSGMYTLQSLWTMARERLDVCVVIFANRGNQILRGEMAAMGVAEVGRNAVRMFDVVDPSLDWVALARGHGGAGDRCGSVRRGLCGGDGVARATAYRSGLLRE